MVKNKRERFSFKNIFKVNRLVRFFILSDLFFMGGWGLVNPIFSLFVVRDIPGASLITVGIVVGIYWFTKAIVQLPVALLIDKREGERDDFKVLILSLNLMRIKLFYQKVLLRESDL